MKLVKVTLISLIVLANTFDKIPKQLKYNSISEKQPQRRRQDGDTDPPAADPKDTTACATDGSYIIVKYSTKVNLTSSNLGESVEKICSNYTPTTDNGIEATDFEFYIKDDTNSLGNIFEFQKENISSIDFSNFKPTKNLESMNSLFKGLSGLESINFGELNTADVTDMGEMFQNCSTLKSVNLTSFSTSKVTNMASMFEGNKALESLNLSNFKTSLVTNMSKMFSDCEKLVLLDISNFDLEGLKDGSGAGGSGSSSSSSSKPSSSTNQDQSASPTQTPTESNKETGGRLLDEETTNTDPSPATT